MEIKTVAPVGMTKLSLLMGRLQLYAVSVPHANAQRL